MSDTETYKSADVEECVKEVDEVAHELFLLSGPNDRLAALAGRLHTAIAPLRPPERQTAPAPTETRPMHLDTIECWRCKGPMVRTGTCYTCNACGATSGCDDD